MENEQDNELPEAPAGAPVQDLSVFDDDPLASVHVGSDEEALKKIGRRTTPFGRIVAVLLILGVGAMVGIYLWQEGLKEEQQAKLDAINALEDRSQVAPELRALWPQVSDQGLQEIIVRNLGLLEDPEAVPILIEALDEAGMVRRSAAIALVRIGLPAAEPAKNKLMEVLDDTDELDRAQVVWALAVLREERAADAIIEQFAAGRLQEMLADTPGLAFDPKVITDVLGPSRLGSDDLLNHEDEPVRLLTAQALAEVGDASAIDPLTRLISLETARPPNEQSAEVLRSAAAGLGRTGDPSAAEPLFGLLGSHDGLRPGILEAIKKSTGAPAIATLLGRASDVTVKRDLVRLLAESHDPRAADTLAGLLGSEDEEIKVTSALALAELGDERSVDALVAIGGGEDEGNSDAALLALRRLRAEAAAPGLMELLPDSCPDEPEPEMEAGCFRQAALLRALGATGDQSVGPRLMDALTGVDAPPAAMALADLNYEPGFDKLMEMAPRPSDVDMGASNAADRSLENEDLLRARRGAIQGLGRYGRADAAEVLMTIVEDDDDDYELRAMAATSLGKVATDADMRTIISKAQDESVDEDARRYYVQALWQKPRAELNGALLDLIASDAPGDIKRAAALAVGYSGDPGADARLIEMMADEEARRYASFAIALGGSREAARALVDVLAEDDDTQEILQYGLMTEENDWFNQITRQMFESGQIWRRVNAAAVLQEGNGRNRYGYAWLNVVAVLRTGWNGLDGMAPYEIRVKLYEALTGEDAERRELAADLLGDLNERGLLIRARDEGGTGSQEAHDKLNRLNRPEAS